MNDVDQTFTQKKNKEHGFGDGTVAHATAIRQNRQIYFLSLFVRVGILKIGLCTCKPTKNVL